jgi:CheY-like chemotaxis protein
MHDHYDVLEVSPAASAEEIREQYLFLMQAWHPDKFASASHKRRAEEKCKQINAAYDVLRDADKRAEYDRQRGGAAPRVRPQTARRSSPPEPPPPPVDFEQPWDEQEWIRIFFEQARRRQSARPGPGSEAAPVCVLVVDDTVKARTEIRRMLGRAADIRVVGEASSGPEALHEFETLRPDVVITGLHPAAALRDTPALDGLAVTQAVRRTHPMAKVIVVSEHSSAGYIRQASMAGACDFLTKPVRPADLLAAVRLAGRPLAVDG